MPAKVDLSKIKQAIKEATDRLLSKSNVVKYGKLAAKYIRVRTRLGFGVDKDGSKRKKLKPLSDSYKRQRAGKIAFFTDDNGVVHPIDKPNKKPKLSNETTPNRSNLTYSGQMLDSIDVVRSSKNKVEIGFSGQRNDDKTNDEIASYAEDSGRKFMHLSDLEIKRLSDTVRVDIIKEVEKAFSKLK